LSFVALNGGDMLVVDGSMLWVGVKDDGSILVVNDCVLRAEIEDEGVLEDNRWWCPGSQDDDRCKLFEILLSVGGERAGPKILGHGHPIGHAHL
jgi:hypothetical protein